MARRAAPKSASRSAPAPRRRRSEGGCIRSFISFITSSVMILALAAAGAYFLFMAEADRAGPAPQQTTFMVERGASATSVGQDLEQQGLIRSELAFRAALRVFAEGKTLQAGEYEIPAGASLKQIVEDMSSGRALQHAVTIPEGYTTAMAMKVIAESDVLTGDMPARPPEGSLMPETYHVQRGMTRAALVQQMQDAMTETLAEVWAGRDLTVPVRTPQELVTLASIVEKETGVPNERARVAAVFVNRLRIGMPLQTDPTIIYGVCLRLPARCRDGRLINERTGQIRTIRESEIAMDTGYNTYRIQRLPPTPIANPGRDALQAAAHPAATRDLYFVADGSGGHAFAETVAQHQANVERWRVIERQRLAEEAAHPSN